MSSSDFETFRLRKMQSKRLEWFLQSNSFDYTISKSHITTRYLPFTLLLESTSLHVTLSAYHPCWASSTLITCKNKIGYSYIVGK